MSIVYFETMLDTSNCFYKEPTNVGFYKRSLLLNGKNIHWMHDWPFTREYYLYYL